MFIKLLTQFFAFSVPLLVSTAILANPEEQPVFEPSIFMASLRVLWGLLLVLAIIFAIYAFAKKRFNFLPANNAKSIIKVIEAKHLMPKKSIYLIEVRDKEYLVGVTDHSINLLSSSLKPDSFKEVFSDSLPTGEKND